MEYSETSSSCSVTYCMGEDTDHNITNVSIQIQVESDKAAPEALILQPK